MISAGVANPSIDQIESTVSSGGGGLWPYIATRASLQDSPTIPIDQSFQMTYDTTLSRCTTIDCNPASATVRVHYPSNSQALQGADTPPLVVTSVQSIEQSTQRFIYPPLVWGIRRHWTGVDILGLEAEHIVRGLGVKPQKQKTYITVFLRRYYR